MKFFYKSKTNHQTSNMKNKSLQYLGDIISCKLLTPYYLRILLPIQLIRELQFP